MSCLIGLLCNIILLNCYASMSFQVCQCTHELTVCISVLCCFWTSMDLSTALDCFPHCLTICRLYSYSVFREACTLIACYLRGRKQWIKQANTRSEWTELLKGVPQGSVLVPLIFDILINEIFHFVSNVDLYNYADDNYIPWIRRIGGYYGFTSKPPAARKWC